jgi:hypothetical protein
MSIVFDEESSNVPKNHHVNILLFKSLESILLCQVDMAFEELRLLPITFIESYRV